MSLPSHKKRGSIDLVSQSWSLKFLYWLPKLNPSLRHLETFPIERDFLLSLAMWLKRFQADGVGVVARSWDLAQKWRANTLSSSSSFSTTLLRSTVSGMKLPEGEIRLSPPTILTWCSCTAQSHISHRRVNSYPTAFPYGNGMVLHFYQQQESSTTKTVHKVINKGLKTYV